MSRPVDDPPEIVLRLAREAASSVWQQGEFDMPGVLDGRFDDSLGVRIAVRAILHAHGPLLEMAEVVKRTPAPKPSLFARLRHR